MFIGEFISYESQKIVDLLAHIGISASVSTIETIQSVILFLLMLFGCIFGIVKFIIWIKARCSQNYILEECKKIIPVDYMSYFEEYDKYIDTNFQTKAPNDYADPIENMSQVSGQSLISFYLNHVLTESNNSARLFCILAGSGMGKTTVSVHLCAEYLRKYKKGKHPYNICILTLADKNVISKIEKIEEHGKTILILDALDENREAAENYEQFQQQLDNVIADFRFVIITCRTQFFQSEEDELKNTNIPNRGKDKGYLSFIKHYISPLNKNEIEDYLLKKFRYKLKKRKRAVKIVNQCSSLMVRPLLLSYIDLLVEKKETYDTITSIYDALIQKWIEREVANIKNEQERKKQYNLLLQFSKDFALALLNTENLSTALRMTGKEYDSFIHEKGYTTITYDYGGRSLINRDSEGRRKFAHKSFFEYFLAVTKFDSPITLIPKEGFDMVHSFYKDMVLENIGNYNNFGLHYLENKNTKEGYIEILSSIDFNYQHLDILNIREILIVPIVILSAVEWLKSSAITKVHIQNYTGEDISSILQMPNIKELHIYTNEKTDIRSISNIAISPIKLNNNFIKRAQKKLDVLEYDFVDIKNMNITSLLRRGMMLKEYDKILKLVRIKLK